MFRVAPERETVEEWALVLAAAGIPHRVEPSGSGWRLVVPAGEAETAAAALAAYAEAAPDEARRARVRGRRGSDCGSPCSSSVSIWRPMRARRRRRGRSHRRRRGVRGQAWLAIGGSLALLGVLGTAARADLGAHLLGFVCGGAVGVGTALVLRVG